MPHVQMVTTETTIQILVNYVTTNVKHVLEVTMPHVQPVKKDCIYTATNVSMYAQMGTMQMLMELAKNVMVIVQHVMVPTPTIV